MACIMVMLRQTSCYIRASRVVTMHTVRVTAVTVRLGCVTHGMSHGVQLKVTDDGGGFDVPAAMIGRHTGMGLRLMRVAVGLAGGEVIIVSSAGAGTCVTVTLPLD